MWIFTSLLRTANCPQISVHWYIFPMAPFPQQVPGLRSHRGVNCTEDSQSRLPHAVNIGLASILWTLEKLERSYKLPDFVLWKSVEEEKRPMICRAFWKWKQALYLALQNCLKNTYFLQWKTEQRTASVLSLPFGFVCERSRPIRTALLNISQHLAKYEQIAIWEPLEIERGMIIFFLLDFFPEN